MRTLLFVVNRMSGGRQGAWLARQLGHRYPAEALVELSGCDLPALAARAAAGGAALVACGGDGTVAAALEATWLPGAGIPAPVGAIPLGTGNDLARVLGWGHRLPGLSALDGMLVRLQNARTSAHDRWVVEGPEGTLAWFNYLSIGVDARIARRFHRLRRHHPWLFRGGAVNKALYAAVAMAEVQSPLADAVEIAGTTLPPWARSLVFANIPSYAGGTVLGPDISPVDGHLDGFVLGPGAALGLAAGGIRRPCRLPTSPVFDLTLQRPLVMQVDGEPSLAPAGRYRLRREGMVRVLVAR